MSFLPEWLTKALKKVPLKKGKNAVTFNGSVWSKPTPESNSFDPTSVSCVDPHFSVASSAVQGSEGTYLFKRSTWTLIQPTGGNVSCLATAFCVLLGGKGTAYSSA